MMKYKVIDHIVFREMEGESIAINLDKGTYYTMNIVGTRMWQLLQEKYSLPEIAQMIESEYDVPLTQVEADLKSFIEDLQENGLVEQD